MSRLSLLVASLPALWLLCGFDLAQAKPPVVVKAIPDNGDVDVDPSLTELQVTFDQPMSPGGVSIVGGGEQLPEIQGEPRWVDPKTVALSIKLKPNHSYWLSINSDRFQNFKNRAGEAAEPYPISFRTGAGGGRQVEKPENGDVPAELTPPQNKKAVNLLRTALAKHYSHRDRLGIKWAPFVSKKRDALIAAKTPREFAEIAATLLAAAQDKHIWLQVGDEQIPTYVKPPLPNVNFKLLPTIVSEWQAHNNTVASGKLADDAVYLWIGSWDRNRAEDLKAAFEVLVGAKDSRALVIDVRGNGGGDERLARAFAGGFVDQPVVYAKNLSVDPNQPGKFLPMHERMLQPNPRLGRIRGQVIVLTGPVVMSSCESFLQMMQQAPGAVLVGGASQGSSGNPKPHDLQNGVTVFLPSWKELTADGQEIEGKGIAPDELVEAEPEDFQSADPVIEAALRILNSGH